MRQQDRLEAIFSLPPPLGHWLGRHRTPGEGELNELVRSAGQRRDDDAAAHRDVWPTLAACGVCAHAASGSLRDRPDRAAARRELFSSLPKAAGTAGIADAVGTRERDVARP